MGGYLQYSKVVGVLDVLLKVGVLSSASFKKWKVGKSRVWRLYRVLFE